MKFIHLEFSNLIGHFDRTIVQIIIYALCILSFSHASFFFKHYRIQNIWLPPGIEPGTACLTHKCSATDCGYKC